MKRNLTIKLCPLLLFLITVCSCTGTIGPGAPTDPEFSGIWSGSGVIIRIVHHSGLLTAHGFNPNEGAAWDRLSFSGKVTAIGAAKGEAILWTTGPSGNSVHVASVLVYFSRSGGTVTFDLDYYSNYDYAQHDEHYELQKQP
ncbi:MAG: hypothetical protein ACUZ8A_05570 [Candidatus Bathyanammoxibius sp.]